MDRYFERVSFDPLGCDCERIFWFHHYPWIPAISAAKPGDSDSDCGNSPIRDDDHNRPNDNLNA